MDTGDGGPDAQAPGTLESTGRNSGCCQDGEGDEPGHRPVSPSLKQARSADCIVLADNTVVADLASNKSRTHSV